MADSSPYLFSLDIALTSLHSGSFSLSFWLQPSSGPTYVSTILIENPGFKIVLNADGTISFSIFNSVQDVLQTVTSTEVVVGSNWNHVTVVYDTAFHTLTVYVNGVARTAAYTYSADSSTSQLVSAFQLGNNFIEDFGVSAAFALDSVSVWNRVLTSFEVATLVNNGDGLEYPFLGGPLSLIFQASLINDPPTPLVLGSGSQLWTADRSFDPVTNLFRATMGLLYSGTSTSRGFRWTADNFYDKVIIAQHDNPVQYWTPPLPNVAQAVPGLPTDDSKWDGVSVFFGHVLLWKSDRLKWSDKDDFTSWIPVGQTAVSAVLNITSSFSQPSRGGTVTIQVANTVGQVVSVSLSGSLNFPDTDVGSSSQSLLTISNTGTVALDVTGIDYTAASGFSGNFIGSIPVGVSQPVTITFSPTDAITYSGHITIVVNGAAQGTTSIAAVGTGIGNSKVIDLSGVLAFGDVVKGYSVSSSLIITNTGNTTLTVSSISLPSGYSGSFSGTIVAGTSHAVAVTFSPSAAGSYNGNISVSSDATSGVGSAAVSGTGISGFSSGGGDYFFVTDNGSCQFGGIPTGSTADGTLRIYNKLGGASKVLGVTLPDGFSLPSNPFPATIDARSYLDVTVRFSPVNSIGYGGIVVVSYSRNGATGNTILISGNGVASGKVLVLSGSLDFGQVPVNGTAQSLLTLTNVGTASVTVTGIDYTAASGFSGAYSGSIAPGQSKQVLITFSPTVAQDYSGPVVVHSDDIAGTDSISASGTGVALLAPPVLVAGQFVTIATGQDVNYYQVISMTGTNLVLQLLDFTGISSPGTPISSGQQIFTVDANEAGETRVVGSSVNGPIFKIITQGEYAFIFKERSVLSMQYVGVTSGTFFIRPEVMGEGLLARDGALNLSDGRIIFLGHKELYQYTGGPAPAPVCQQFTRQMYRELDRARLYKVLMFHYETKNEIWLQYPVVGGLTKVLIWNYVEDTASIDNYDPAISFTSLGFSDWSSDPVWQDFAESTTWFTIDPSLVWQDMVGTEMDHIPLFGSEDGNLRVYGMRFARDGEPYLSLSETMDFDLGDCDLWKYVDVVVLGLQVRNPTNTIRNMYVQVGGRAGLNDDDITWSAPQAVLVNGYAKNPVKVNPGGAGRYLRLRFFSSDVDVEWRVSSFEIHCRPGGFY